MKNSRKNRFSINYAGRRIHPTGARLVKPWEHGLRKDCEEIWYVFQGEGRIRREQGEWQPVKQGMLIWYRSNNFYELEQMPDRPLGVNFFHFNGKRPVNWDPEVSETLETTDPSFVDSLSRRMIELYWEEYYDSAVNEGKIPGSPGVPAPRFVSEPETIRKDFVLPETMGLRIPEKADSELLHLAEDLFNSLVGEYFHLARKRFDEHEVGIQRHHRSTIAGIVAEIQSDLSNAPSIPQMAASCGYSLDHFGRIFRKIMGTSPQDFLINVRVARARQLLVESGLTIKEIAISVGYRSPYFFSRQFKDITGEPPTEFRKRHSATRVDRVK